MTIFSIVIAAALATFVAEGVLTGRWDAVAMQTFDLVRSSVLPVVTLILGYYFGRSGADERPGRQQGDPP